MEENNIDLSVVYLTLSQETNTDFGDIDDSKLLESIFDKLLTDTERLIDSNELSKNVNQLNIIFVKILKHCIDINFRKFSYLFIFYCDYFSLDYNVVYNAFHDKIKKVIEKDSKRIIGVEKYNKLSASKNKQGFNLFDLIKK